MTDTQDIVWVDPIAVDGKRPGWLEKSDMFLAKGLKAWYSSPWGGDHLQLPQWEPVSHIRLPADHPYYRQPASIPEGMKAWHGGDEAPADWDSDKPIAVDNNGNMELRYGYRWNWSREAVTPYGQKLLRVVAYTPQPIPQADTKPDVTTRMEALVRRMVEQDPALYWRDIRDEARAIVALLPEPVDPDLIEARECVAEVYEQSGRVDLAQQTRDGQQDNRLRVQSARLALARGRELALAGETGK